MSSWGAKETICPHMVFVVSSCLDEDIRAGVSREGAVGYYSLPLQYKLILGAIEVAAEGAVIIV